MTSHLPSACAHLPLRRTLAALLLAAAALLLGARTGYAQEPAPAAVTGTTVDRDITQNTTWTKAGSPYNVTDLVDVAAGATLTIEPGVTVIVGRPSDPQWSFPMYIKGTLNAQGTAAEPITFTAVEPTVGRWAGLVAGNSEQQPAQITLNHVIVEYGASPNSWNKANLELQSVVADINNSIFRKGGSYGLSAGFSTQLNLRNSSFVDNGVGAVLQYFLRPKFDMALSNLSASGNGSFNAVVYESLTLDKPHRLEKMGLPYVFKGGFTVEHGGELNIDPGIELRVDTGFYVHGVMKALGTAAEPILLTGIKQQPAGWWGLRVSGGTQGMANVTLDHVTIEYGGEDTEDWGGNLVLSSANVTVTNSILRNSGSHGLFSDGGSPDETFSVKVSNTAITGNRLAAVVCADESCNYAFDSLSVSGNGTNGIVYRSFAMSNGTWRNLGLPYIIEGQGGVGSDAVLTIEPGVEVRMAKDASFAVHGVLSAVGTASQPVIFTGTQQQAGWWKGIQVSNDGVAELRHCDIGYGGNWGPVESSALVTTQGSSLALSNCRIHDSSSAGIMVVAGAKPTLRNNRIENNQRGLIALFPLEQVDARFNWWGHASGPKHTDNPSGQGQEIIGNVAYDPWLRSPDETGGGNTGITVDLNGPGRYAPGDTIIYSIFYYNGTGSPIDNAVLRFGMPANSVLLDASANSVFHTQRNHVFWKLGNLPAGGQGLLWVRVQYDWGLPDGMKTATAAQLSGSNLPSPVFNVNDYLSYTPRTLQTLADLSLDEVNALRGASPDLDKLYQQAVAAGFKFGAAERHTYSTGQQEVEIRLLRFNPHMNLLSLWLANNQAVGTLVDYSSYTVIRAGQAARYDLQTNAWAPVTLNPLQAAEAHDGISWSDCVTNCIEEKLPGYILKKKIKSISELSKISNCTKSAAGDESGYLGCAKWVGKKIPFIGEGIDLGQCNGECDLCVEGGGSCDNPYCYCCTDDKYSCDANDWLYGTFGVEVIKMKKCNLEEGDDRGTYFAEVVFKTCALCEKCMDNGGSPVCVAKVSNFEVLNTLATVVGLAAQQGAQDRLEVAASSDEECDECRQAKDPNEMYGPAGDLLPGQLVTYEIAYENIGEGTAFGVFIMNKLPEGVFDLNTLQINNGGAYSAGSKSISWDVGDLAPKGQPGASGKVSYTVRLRSDLPSGTPIVNAAVVHFPSVPEETPTNRVVNLIQPLVAEPQALQTEVGVAIPLTLSGRDAVGTPLTFTIVEAPVYGTVAGTAPNLTYMPNAGAGGLDRIRFTVSNGASTSTPADVAVRILPSSSDVTGPAVTWSAPQQGAQVTLAALVAGQDSTGSYYYPAIQVQFSEPLAPASVNGQSVLVTDAAGKTVKADVRYDASIDQVQLLLREEPRTGMTYTVTVTTAVKDLRGNSMAANHAFAFTIAGLRQPADEPTVYLPVIKR